MLAIYYFISFLPSKYFPICLLSWLTACLIFSGIIICYAVSFAVLATPSFITCFISRTLPPVAFSMIYSALLTKTNRIARILSGSKKLILTKKPRFLSTASQVSHDLFQDNDKLFSIQYFLITETDEKNGEKN